MSDIADRIKKIIIEQLNVEEEQVTPTAHFVEAHQGQNAVHPIHYC